MNQNQPRSQSQPNKPAGKPAPAPTTPSKPGAAPQKPGPKR